MQNASPNPSQVQRTHELQKQQLLHAAANAREANLFRYEPYSMTLTLTLTLTLALTLSLTLALALALALSPTLTLTPTRSASRSS